MQKKVSIFFTIFLSSFSFFQLNCNEDPYSFFGSIKGAREPHFMAHTNFVAVIKDGAIILYELKEDFPERGRFSYGVDSVQTFIINQTGSVFAVYTESTTTQKLYVQGSAPPRSFIVNEPLSSLQFYLGPLGEHPQQPWVVAKKGTSISAFNYRSTNPTWLPIFENVNFTHHFCILDTHFYVADNNAFYDIDLAKFPDDQTKYPNYLPLCDESSPEQSLVNTKTSIFPIPVTCNEKYNRVFMSQKKASGRGRPLLYSFRLADKCFEQLIDEMHFDYVVSKEETICLAGEALFIVSDKGSQIEEGDFVDPAISNDTQFIAAYDYDDDEVKIWKKNPTH